MRASSTSSASMRDRRLARDVAVQQALAVLREHRHVPDLRVHRHADEPAEQHVVGDLFHPLALRSHTEEGLQQLLRRDRGAAAWRAMLIELRRCRSNTRFTSTRIARSG
jgi:hypothetical protein